MVIDDFSGETRVYGVGGGGSTGVFFRFDWGAADSFSTSIANALEGYEVIGRKPAGSDKSFGHKF